MDWFLYNNGLRHEKVKSKFWRETLKKRAKLMKYVPNTTVEQTNPFTL